MVSGHGQFLHDGRARSLLEAILWHGGEAQAARDGVVSLPTEDREALIAFLQSQHCGPTLRCLPLPSGRGPAVSSSATLVRMQQMF